ncbi:hypothetical protein BEL01nite_81300 [Bradyrhizobium elkanii]|nr:hypothetical protein BEL01nite_81300 [Bradyrhizobium elkanii]
MVPTTSRFVVTDPKGLHGGAEADRRAREGDPAAAGRCALPKAMKPGRKRKLVDEVRGEWQVSIRKAVTGMRPPPSPLWGCAR